ncbi:hypothetical protein K6U20_15500, partial [Vibrio fluvialis]|uniref:hypothetical protein n=1 Tax=Vibrio fluvialis TaxID=676 RepID=UPI001EE9BE31
PPPPPPPPPPTNAVFFMRMLIVAELLHSGRKGAQTIGMLAGKILKLLLHEVHSLALINKASIGTHAVVE